MILEKVKVGHAMANKFNSDGNIGALQPEFARKYCKSANSKELIGAALFVAQT